MMLLNLGHASGCLTAQDFSYILEYCADTADSLVSLLPTRYLFLLLTTCHKISKMLCFCSPLETLVNEIQKRDTEKLAFAHLI